MKVTDLSAVEYFAIEAVPTPSGQFILTQSQLNSAPDAIRAGVERLCGQEVPGEHQAWYAKEWQVAKLRQERARFYARGLKYSDIWT